MCCDANSHGLVHYKFQMRRARYGTSNKKRSVSEMSVRLLIHAAGSVLLGHQVAVLTCPVPKSTTRNGLASSRYLPGEEESLPNRKMKSN